MLPKKIKKNIFKDKRGYLMEIVPKNFKKKFAYSILTESKKNVLRGMHFNKKMNEEKLLIILNGRILDVLVNLNKGKNFGNIFYYNLKKNDILFIPKGFAHGYYCYGEKNIILYLLSKKYCKNDSSGFFWSDKNFNIKWNVKKPNLSSKDKTLKEFTKN
jgi:dTDP-4-dehydrorhamnose 3,5-epimerase